MLMEMQIVVTGGSLEDSKAALELTATNGIINSIVVSSHQ